jgi:uncharacterized membrane protein
MTIRRRPAAPSRLRRDRGAVLSLVALTMPVLLLMTAFAIDLGRQRSSRRTMQARADIVALDLVRLADGRTEGQIMVEAPAELAASAMRNKVDPAKLDFDYGTWSEASGFIPTLDTAVPNAVMVSAGEAVDYYFRPGEGSTARSAVATINDEGSAEHVLGSTLINVTPASSSVIGQVLQSVIPGADVIGYQGLANATVTLGQLAAALNLGSVEELLGATVTYEQLVVAAADALQGGGGSVAAVGVLDQLIALGIEDFQVEVADVVGAGTTGSSGTDARVSIPQLLLAGAGIADGTHAVTIPATVLNVAGLAGVTLDLNVIEGPVRVGTHDGASGSTDQVDLGVRISLDVSGNKNQRLCDLPANERTLLGQLLGGVFRLLNCLLAPLTTSPLDVRVAGTIDLALRVAEATTTQSIDCGAPALLVAYQTGPVAVTATTALTASVALDGSPLTLLGVSAPAAAMAASGASGTASFPATDLGPRHITFNPTTSRVGSPNLGLANLLQVGGLKVTVANADLPVLGGIARDLVQPVINHILGQVDQIVVTEVSKLLGLNLGGADITPQWMECKEDRLRLVG